MPGRKEVPGSCDEKDYCSVRTPGTLQSALPCVLNSLINNKQMNIDLFMAEKYFKYMPDVKSWSGYEDMKMQSN